MAALRLADLLGHIADIDDAVGIKLRPIAEPEDDVRAGAGLHRRGNPRLDIVGVDALDIELDAEILLALRGDLGLQQLIGSGNKVIPAQPMQSRLLGVSRCPACRQNAGDPGGLRRSSASAGDLQKSPTGDPRHNVPPELLTSAAESRRFAPRPRIFRGKRSRAQGGLPEHAGAAKAGLRRTIARAALIDRVYPREQAG